MCNASYMETAALAKKIADIRIASGDNLEQAAGKIGVSRQAYRKWEIGATANMKLEHLAKFCDAYGVAIEDMVRASSRPAARIAPRAVDSRAPDEARLLDGFAMATPEIREAMLDMADRARARFQPRTEMC